MSITSSISIDGDQVQGGAAGFAATDLVGAFAGATFFIADFTGTVIVFGFFGAHIAALSSLTGLPLSLSGILHLHGLSVRGSGLEKIEAILAWTSDNWVMCVQFTSILFLVQFFSFFVDI